MYVNEERLTAAAQEAYDAKLAYEEANDLYKSAVRNMPVPETPREPTPKEYNDYRKERAEIVSLHNRLSEPRKKALKHYGETVRELMRVFPSGVRTMKLTLRDGVFLVSYNNSINSRVAHFTEVIE